MGVGAVASILVADEVEHHRCGIGCILESNHSTGGVYMTKIIRGGSAERSKIQEGDEIIQINGTRVVRGRDNVDSVSGYIRGKEGSIVTVCVRKPWGEVVSVRLVRTRLPGAKAELLGALWQNRGEREHRALTLEDKIDVLEQLHMRGNLTDREYHVARRRLTEESAGPGHQVDANRMDQNDMSVAAFIKIVQEDWARLTRDPALEGARARLRGSISSDESTTPRSHQSSSARSATPLSNHWAASPRTPGSDRGRTRYSPNRSGPDARLGDEGSVGGHWPAVPAAP